MYNVYTPYSDFSKNMPHTAKHKLIVIVGPTGVGKSDVAVALAQRLGGAATTSTSEAPATAPSGAAYPAHVLASPLHILSADSRQLFRGMAIGTAQPTAEQLQAAPHHFVACASPTERYTCARWAAEAEELLKELFKKHTAVIVAGGSGLYVDALCNGIDPMPDHDPALRERLSLQTLDQLLEQLRTLDPMFWEQIDRRNPRRVLRAVEVCLQTGRPYSEHRTSVPHAHQRTVPHEYADVIPRGGASRPQGDERISSPSKDNHDFDIIKIGLDLPREELYDRIERRVDAMMTAELEAEARALLPLRAHNALQTVGYRELFDYFDGLTSLPQAVELIKRNSRRYAKRQLTWLRRDPSIRWFSPRDIEGILQSVQSEWQRELRVCSF